MEGLRNPFAIRNGSIILIEDLTKSERGLKCQCQCPACGGDFIARFGDVKVHHFAHSKDACDEVIAYTSGLYKLIHQILNSEVSFYVPSLVVKYHFSYKYELNADNIADHIEIVPEWEDFEDQKLTLFEGLDVVFDNVDFCYDSKGHIIALETTCRGRKMALKVMPPNTICKIGKVSPHNDIATLALDFSNDSDRIQGLNSEAFQEYLLSVNLPKLWISNPKVKKAYPIVIKKREIAYHKYLKKQELLKEKEAAERLLREERMKLDAQQRAEREKRIIQQQLFNDREAYDLGYAQVKDCFNQQTTPIRDDYGYRWIECEICGEIKRDVDFPSYGGLNRVNLGQCAVCLRKKEKR